MKASPTTLAEYIGDGEAPVIVEHARCMGDLGTHLAFYMLEGVGPPEGFYTLRRTREAVTSSLMLPRKEITPGVVGFAWQRGEWYERVRCPCLPRGHNEKIGPRLVGLLPVTFPEWKWGRPIDLPVVTI